ncbi:tRNA (guanosine(37)-N1)-methyltransferase TrmD [soil metagenome]
MIFDIFTIFPAMLESPFSESIIQRARDRGIVEIRTHDIREYGIGKHRSVDDTPFGGGPGMVMSAAPIVESVESAVRGRLEATTVLVMTPSGIRLTQSIVGELAAEQHIAIICGRYEGVDQRAIDYLDALEVSIGDYVVSGGELPAAIVVDAVTRLLPGVINSESLADESHLEGLLEYPHYTRPAEFRGMAVPEVLLSGHHENIRAWRREMAERRTRERRPDLLENHQT